MCKYNKSHYRIISILINKLLCSLLAALLASFIVIVHCTLYIAGTDKHTSLMIKTLNFL